MSPSQKAEIVKIVRTDSICFPVSSSPTESKHSTPRQTTHPRQVRGQRLEFSQRSSEAQNASTPSLFQGPPFPETLQKIILGPFWNPCDKAAPLIQGTQKGTIIYRTDQIPHHVQCRRGVHPAPVTLAIGRLCGRVPFWGFTLRNFY